MATAEGTRFPASEEKEADNKIEINSKGIEMTPAGTSTGAAPQAASMGNEHRTLSPLSTGSFRNPHGKTYSELQDEDIEADDVETDKHKTKTLASQLFSLWDNDNNGELSLQEIRDGDIEEEFATALMRVLAHYSGNTDAFRQEHLIECLVTLKVGSLAEKVNLFVKFIDRGNNGVVDFEEATYYLTIAPKEICKKLGFVSERGDRKSLSYNDILALFENSDRGDEAITIFCNHIVNVLTTKCNESMQRRARLLRAASFSFAGVAASAGASSVPHTPIVCGGTSSTLMSLQARLHKIPKVTFFFAALIALQIALWLVNFFHYYHNDMPIAFCIAKGFGLNLRILTILLFATMARTTMGFASNLKIIKKIVPLGSNIQVHSFIGFCTVFHSLGHMCGHIFFHEKYVKDGFKHAFEQKSLLQGASWNSPGKGDGITGYILLFIILTMAGAALLRSRSSDYFRYFTWTHYLYNAWLVVLVLHVPHLWHYFVITGCIMIAERGYDYFQQTLHATLLTSRPCSNGVTFLSVPRHGDSTYAGSYYRIKVPAISAVEWHPFSLAGSVSSHHLTFFVASVGDWTKELYRIVSDPDLRANTTVLVQGPFLAPAHRAVKNPTDTTLLVASGIGITPFFSVMATKVTDEQNYESDRSVFESLFNENLHDYRAVIAAPQAYGGMSTMRQRSRPRLNSSPVISNDGDMRDLEAAIGFLQEEEARPALPASGTSGAASGAGNGAASNKEKVDDKNKDTTDPDIVSVVRMNSSSSRLFPWKMKKDNKYYEQVCLQEVKELRVVWSIREANELIFYLDYVFELVKMQERMLRPAVKVDVYLTGLGKGTMNLKDMMSQTLFLLTVAKRTSHFMKIHFGRPDLEKIVTLGAGDSSPPDQVFYCGGEAMKNMLTTICTREDVNIPFHPEDFDAGANFINQFSKWVMAPITWIRGEKAATKGDARGKKGRTSSVKKK